MTPEQTHDALHRALLALGKGDAPAIVAAREALEGLQIAALRGEARVPLVVELSAHNYAQLLWVVAQISNDVTPASVFAFCGVDGLSEFGADPELPKIEG